jgi:signal transduction histidine kinase
MFRGLRLRLSVLYLLVALAFIVLVGLGTYRLVDSYFQTTIDLALQHRMAHEFLREGAPVTPELEAADRSWYENRRRLFPRIATPEPESPQEADTHEEEPGSGEAGGPPLDNTEQENAEDLYDGELAAIFVVPLDATGQISGTVSALTLPVAPNKPAVTAALATGSDWRTVISDQGLRVRLLTYRLPRNSGAAVLQLGRTLDDQDRILQQLLLALLGLGAASTVLLGIGSWWLAGRALRPAQAAWARQQTFVANASHELRTPLTLLRASAEVVQRGLPREDSDGRALLDDVLQETDHMSRLVEDLLLLSRLDAGRLALERQEVALPALLADMQRQMGRLAEERAVPVEVTRAEGTALADPTRLRQVLLILLDNALRHTPRGGHIALAAQPQGRSVQISVADTGSGIAPEHLTHVFERFYRVDSTPNGTTGGSGLGLAIARGLIEAQHGHITIQSQVGTGTRVTLTLPAQGHEHPSHERK